MLSVFVLPRIQTDIQCLMPVQNIAFKTREMDRRAVISEITVATTGTARMAR
jgi:hypothetical protein